MPLSEPIRQQLEDLLDTPRRKEIDQAARIEEDQSLIWKTPTSDAEGLELIEEGQQVGVDRR